jgi:tellurite resistance protein TehA-like permease
MKTHYLFFLAWFVVIGFWLLNHFKYENLKAEKEQRKKRELEKARGYTNS